MKPAELKRGARMRCNDCEAKLIDEHLIRNGATTGEIGSYMKDLATARGWSHRVSNGELIVSCPVCTAKETEKTMSVLQPYEPIAKCAKCGAEAVSTRYCGSCPHAIEEHLHRACGRCGYEWRQATRDKFPESPAPAPNRKAGGKAHAPN